MNLNRRQCVGGLSLAPLVVGMRPAPAVPRADGLVAGLAADMGSLDPHATPQASDDAVLSHVYESLVALDARAEPVPQLATAWDAIDDRSWQLTLRSSVRFHDGTPMRATDVAQSIRRALRLRPALLVGAHPDALAVDATGDSTLRIRTSAPIPLLMHALAAIRIVPGSVGHADRAPTPPGTGPYRFAGRDDRGVTLAAASATPRWRTLVFRSIPDGHARVAALSAGQVDVVENVPPGAVEPLSRQGRAALHRISTGRLMYLQLGSHATDPPGIELASGLPPGRNPLLDRRVRRAISEAIDRRALIAEVLHGLGEPAGQLVESNSIGFVPGLFPDARNLQDARSLLAEAGYAQGFGLTLHGPRGVYPADADVLQAIAGMLGDVGIRCNAVAEPAAAFAGRAARQRTSAYVRGFTPLSRDASEALMALLVSHDAAAGSGALNWSRYSNGTVDSIVARAVSQPRRDGRELLLQEATRLAMNDVALVPLYFARDAWAARPGFRFAATKAGEPQRPIALLVQPAGMAQSADR